MKYLKSGTNKICLPLIQLLLWILCYTEAQSSTYYRQEYFQPISLRPRHFFRRSNVFGPPTYTRDLIPEESKHKVSPKKYSKPIPHRTSFSADEDDYSFEHFHSDEYSSEARSPASVEQDSREYAFGTQIHVQHPITVPKKISKLHTKPTKKHTPNEDSYGKEGNRSNESQNSDKPSASPLKRRPSKYTPHYDPDPFHVVPPPKTTSPGLIASSSVGYNVYENDFENDYRPPKKTNDNRFKSVASEKQIEQYIEDQQQKLLDEAVKIQLLNNPEFKQFLKQEKRQRFEREHRQAYNEDEGIISPPVPPPSVFLENLEEGITFTTSRPRHARRPQSDFKRSPKRKPPGPLKPKRKFHSAVVIEV